MSNQSGFLLAEAEVEGRCVRDAAPIWLDGGSVCRVMKGRSRCDSSLKMRCHSIACQVAHLQARKLRRPIRKLNATSASRRLG